ncbi:DUF3667 domain-containing protein [Chryseobacterium lathyri]|uniref:DUF3667 domain-containing protein n=1 Tax=Chryseobacterium lathyri TaxID=395933 RepID=UPI0027847DBA|nr:DUF3667 domain-containing protein [Chryseobacterium lathyri]MDQ0064619.1 hypothetical protein [Chryseobacterium lathyri]
MNPKICLNCGHKISGEFCSHCGQKADTARITPRSLIKTDVLGSIWHIEERFFRTLKHILFGPGRMAMDYISGKRIKYYNLFSLLLILFGFNVLTMHFYLDLNPDEIRKESSKIFEFFSRYSKTILFVIIPILGTNAYFIFKRMKLNIAEHFIIGTVSLLGILIIFLFNDMISLIGLWKPAAKIFGILEKASFVLFILFPAVTYWNAFKKSYSKPGLLWRVSLLYVLMGIESLGIIAILYRIL